MTENDISERIRAYKGEAKIVLKNEEGVEETFKVRSLRPRDIALIMEAAGDEKISDLQGKKEEDFTGEDMVRFLDAISGISVDVLMRSYPDKFTKEDAEEIVMSNFEAFISCVLSQITKFRMSDDKRKLSKLKHLTRDGPGT